MKEKFKVITSKTNPQGLFDSKEILAELLIHPSAIGI